MRLEQASWVLSARTSRSLFVSCVVVLTVGCLAMLAGIFQPPAMRELAGCALFIMVGMMWYWARFDDSPRLVKLLWLASFLFLGWISMSIYYFAVYRSQRRLVVSTNQ